MKNSGDRSIRNFSSLRLTGCIETFSFQGLNQLNSNSKFRFRAHFFYFTKMIPRKSWYKTYNAELLAIYQAFKSQRNYQKGYKYKIFCTYPS